MTQSTPSNPAPLHPRTRRTPMASSTVPLLGDTIGANLDRTAHRVGDHEALVECVTGRRFSYPELVDEVDACALGLAALGVVKGDRVGIWAPNCAEWVFVQFGTAKLGAIMVNINPAYRTHELRTSASKPASRCWSARRSSRPATTARWSPRYAATAPICAT